MPCGKRFANKHYFSLLDMKLTTYLRRLNANNNRVWFNEHRAQFDEQRQRWIAQVQQLIDLSAEWAPEFRFLNAKDCTFRIYRDTRFSTDKTPYKTYFSSYMSVGNRQFHQRAGYYISAGITPDNNALFGGLWMPDRQLLRKMRRAIVDNVEEFREIINAPELVALYPDWVGDRLKTIPQGWPKDHPDADLLRLNHYGRECIVAPDFFDSPQWPERASEMLRPLKPLIDWLNYTITEE